MSNPLSTEPHILDIQINILAIKPNILKINISIIKIDMFNHWDNKKHILKWGEKKNKFIMIILFPISPFVPPHQTS